MPEGDAWKGAVVFWFELGDDVKREAGLLGYLSVAAFVVLAVAYFLTHETVSVMSIERGFGKTLISSEVTSPTQAGPNKSSNCRVHISRLNCVEELPIAEDIPDSSSDAVGLT